MPDNYGEIRAELSPQYYENTRAFGALNKPMAHLYNTELDPMQERAFQVWAAQRSNELGRNVLNDVHNYDIRADFLGGKGLDPVTKHGADIGKKPNHDTFSTGSKYSVPGREGGTWREAPGVVDGEPIDGNFVPSPYMMRDDARMRKLVEYLKREERRMPFLSPYIAAPVAQ